MSEFLVRRKDLYDMHKLSQLGVADSDNLASYF